VAPKIRLDAELVRRGLVRSRSEGARAIGKGQVKVGGIPVVRPAALVDAAAPITLAEGSPRFVSRGGEKLDGALQHFDVRVAGRRWADAGASTGGFTDCLLQRGAASVLALDVGYGQLDWRLRNDARVIVLERTNVRSLNPSLIPWPAEGVVADLAFISLAMALPGLRAIAEPDADFVVLVKPQFELDRLAIGKGGVVRERDGWVRALRRVITAAEHLSLGVAGAIASPLVGPAGNREFFLHLRVGADEDSERAVETAVSGAPE
jgi:23S rRNA (cytidine1920-2'-O)/16S rRNA (cytidine1409-2'-O)-methyltransferase